MCHKVITVHTSQISVSTNVSLFYQKEEAKARLEKNRADGKTGILPETAKAVEPTAVRNESLVEQVEFGEGSRVEYTELALECLDLKAQQELFSPPLSGRKKITVVALKDLF